MTNSVVGPLFIELISKGSSQLWLPLKTGTIFQTPRPPTLRYCPSASSMKYMGIPAKIAVITNGIRNAPANKENKTSSHCPNGVSGIYVMLLQDD